MKKYHTPKRLLLKLSWEALQWDQWYGIDPNFLAFLAKKIVYLVREEKLEIVIVVWWGNIFRGIELEAGWFDRVTWDHMGMLGTIINGLAIGEAIEQEGIDVRVMSAIPTQRVAEDFIRRRALRHKDPKKHTDAVRHDTLFLHEVLQKDIRVMDQSAIALANDEWMPIYVCRIEDIDQIGSEAIVGTFVGPK